MKLDYVTASNLKDTMVSINEVIQQLENKILDDLVQFESVKTKYTLANQMVEKMEYKIDEYEKELALIKKKASDDEVARNLKLSQMAEVDVYERRIAQIEKDKEDKINLLDEQIKTRDQEITDSERKNKSEAKKKQEEYDKLLEDYKQVEDKNALLEKTS